MDNVRRQKFSIAARWQSIKYAWNGIIAFFKSQHNSFVHLFFTILVIVMAVVLKISTNEAAVLALLTGSVWVAEIFNSAIEAMMDHLSPAKRPAVKYIKDVSAAAVLVAATTAIAGGAMIFIPKLF